MLDVNRYISVDVKRTDNMTDSFSDLGTQITYLHVARPRRDVFALGICLRISSIMHALYR